QPLIRANVTGGLFPADVLLARLHRQHPATLAAPVQCLADEPARHLAHELLPTRQQPEIRAAITQRTAQALPFGDRDIRAVIARPLQEAQTDRIVTDDEQ